jgi:hypothetical protein
VVSNPFISRGLLVGLSLAELMIIVVFVLLILLGDEKQKFEKIAKFENTLGEAQAQAFINIVNDNPKVPDFGEKLIDEARTLVSEEGLAPLAAEPHEDISIGDPDDQVTREELINTLFAMQRKNEELNEAISRLSGQIMSKAGDRVICTYIKRPELEGGKRSLALGAVFIEKDGVTLLSREPLLYREEKIYDFVLRPYDVTDALEILDGWPLGKKLSLAEFVAIGEKFVAIGEKSSEMRNTCRFALNYDLEVDDVTFDILDKVVEGYFFKGVRISSADADAGNETSNEKSESQGVRSSEEID